MILFHTSLACTTFLAIPLSSYLLYNHSNSGPYTSERPCASCGQKSDQVPLFSTLSMNVFGTQSA